MNALNYILTGISQIVFGMFDWLAPILLLVFLGVVTGGFMAWVYGHTSYQRAIRQVADRSRAELLAIGLFKDDLGVTFRSQRMLLKLSALRIWYAVPAMAVLSLPLLFVVVQLAVRYEYQPLAPGESTIVQVQFSPTAWDMGKGIEIEAPDHVQVESPPLRIIEEQRIVWRIRPLAPVTGSLRWRFPDRVVEKQFSAVERTERLQLVSARRAGPGLIDRLVNPAEPAFAANDPIHGIQFDCPKRTTPLFGWDVPWWITYFLVAMMTPLVTKRWTKVEF